MSSDDCDEDGNSRPYGWLDGLSPALRAETYKRLPEGLATLQEDLRNARVASVALLNKLPDHNTERDLLGRSERRLTAYMLLFSAIVRATIDDIEPSMVGKNARVESWRLVRVRDIVDDHIDALKCLEMFVVTDDFDELSPNVRERQIHNLALFYRAAEAMQMALTSEPARAVHNEAVRRLGGFSSSWFLPYGHDGETQSRAS